MKRALLDAYRRLPESLRYSLRPLNGLEELASFLPTRPRRLLETVAQAGRSLAAARRYRAPLVQLRGVSSVDGAPLTVVTDLGGESYAYWTGLCFAGEPARVSVGEVRGPLGFTRAPLPEADLVLLRHNRLARGHARAAGFLSVPAWVQSFLDTRSSLDAIIEGQRSGRNSRKNDVRKLQRAGLSASVTRDPDDMQRFYEDWYLPFTRERWGATSVLLDRDHMRQAARCCEVLWVSRGGERIAGALLEPQGRVLRCIVFGMRDGAEIQNGALAACYYFMIEHTVRRRFDFVRLGGARPVLSDGALRYKAKWGGALMPVRQWDYVAVRVGHDSAAARAFLTAHPLVVEENGRFLALTAGDPAGLTASLGLSGLLVPAGSGWTARPLHADELAA